MRLCHLTPILDFEPIQSLIVLTHALFHYFMSLDIDRLLPVTGYFHISNIGIIDAPCPGNRAFPHRLGAPTITTRIEEFEAILA